MPVINENTPGDKDVDIYIQTGAGKKEKVSGYLQDFLSREIKYDDNGGIVYGADLSFEENYFIKKYPIW